MTAILGLHVVLLQAKDVGFLAIRALPEVVEWEAAPVRRLWRDVLGGCTSWRHAFTLRAVLTSRPQELTWVVTQLLGVADFFNTKRGVKSSANRRCIGALGRAQVLAQREEEQPPEPQLCALLGEALRLRGLLLTLHAAALDVGAAPRACTAQRENAARPQVAPV